MSPIVTMAHWELVHPHNWNKSDGEFSNWTEKKMLDELLELDKVRVEIRPKATLLEFINEIKHTNGNVIKVKTRTVDFSSICRVINAWQFVTTTCEHFGREFIAQDESHLVCFKGKKCKCGKKDCPDYVPMLEARSIEELIKGEKVTFT